MSSNPDRISETWRRKGGLARWRLSVPIPGERTAREALLSSVLDVVDLLGDFARPTEASWTSATLGEGADEQELGANPQRTLASTSIPDPTEVSLVLSLLYADPVGPACELERAADLWLEFDADAGEVAIVLFLDVDLYAWRSWGRERDNRATAELNAPRLRGFLRRLQTQFGARIEEVDAPDYPGQVDELGFHPPD